MCGKKIYRPEGPIFVPKQRFFILRGMLREKFSILTRGWSKKLLSSLGVVKKLIGSTRVVRSMPCNMKNLSYIYLSSEAKKLFDRKVRTIHTGARLYTPKHLTISEKEIGLRFLKNITFPQ